MKPKLSKTLLLALIWLLILSSCSVFPEEKTQPALSPQPTWTPLPQKTEQAFVIEGNDNRFPFNDTVLILFKPSEREAWQAFDLTNERYYDLSDLPTTDLNSSPLMDQEGKLILHFGQEIYILNASGEKIKIELPAIADPTLRCEFPYQNQIYCLNADLSQAFVIDSDLSLRNIWMNQPQQAVAGEFHPLYRTANDQIRALYPESLHMVLDEGIYLRSFDLKTESFEELLLKMHFDKNESPEVLAKAEANPQAYMSGMEPIEILALVDDLSQAYFNMLTESVIEKNVFYPYTHSIDLNTGLYTYIKPQLTDGLFESTYTYRENLLIPRNKATSSDKNFSWPEVYTLQDMRPTLGLADWLPQDEPIMEVFPYGEGWMLLTSKILYYLDARGIICHRFELSEEVTALLLENIPHTLTRPTEPR